MANWTCHARSPWCSSRFSNSSGACQLRRPCHPRHPQLALLTSISNPSQMYVISILTHAYTHTDAIAFFFFLLLNRICCISLENRVLTLWSTSIRFRIYLSCVYIMHTRCDDDPSRSTHNWRHCPFMCMVVCSLQNQITRATQRHL